MDTSAELSFGELAVKAGYLDRGKFQQLLEEQKQLSQKNENISLAELCSRRKMTTLEQVQKVQLDLQFAAAQT